MASASGRADLKERRSQGKMWTFWALGLAMLYWWGTENEGVR